MMFSFLCTSSLSYVVMVCLVRVWCVVSHYILFAVASAVFPVVSCGLWCLLGVLLVFVLFSWCVIRVTGFCLVFVGFVFLDGTNSFFMSYVTIFCVR